MELTTIPNLSLKASRIGLGTWPMGGSLWGESDEKESIDTIISALELGVNFIDTAPGYGFGQAEELIGKAIKQYGKRDKIIIATKFGLNLDREYDVHRDSRRQSVLKEVDASLKRLNVDYIDLYQVHWPDAYTPQQETATVLQELLDQGKIRSIGVSNYSPQEIEQFSQHAPIHAIQHPFNIFEREAEEQLLPYCKRNGITSIGYSSLCRGLLTGSLKEDQEFEDLRKNFDPKFRKPHFPQYLICVGRLQQWVEDKHHQSLVSLAIRWSLDKGVDIALWGARRPEELEPIHSIMNWKLTQEDFLEIDQIIEETIQDPVGPQFMSPPFRSKDHDEFSDNKPAG
jgi:aryl-alcohol dehydrogenase-like predicted oxidoreductase